MDTDQETKTMRVEKKEVVIVSSIIITFFILMLLVKVADQRIKDRTQAQTPQEIGVQVLSPLSNTEFSGNTAEIDLRTTTPNGVNVLYDSSVTGEAAVLDFMDKNPVIDIAAVSDNEQVKGVTSEDVKKRVLPANFRQNSALSRTLTDRMYKDKSEVKHYYYTQKVAGLPVYGATVRFDVAGGDKVVGVDGEYTLGTSTTPIKLSDQQATDIAINKATEELRKVNPEAAPVVCSDVAPTRKIFNEKLANVSENETNYAAIEVTVCGANNVAFNTFRHVYFVSLEDGRILFDGSLIYEALNRNLYDCNAVGCSVDQRTGRITTRTSSVTRSEGQAAVSDTDVNKSYDFLGDIYNYYFNSHQRDAIDNRGGTLRAYVHVPIPNAMWNGTSMAAATGWIAKDIWAHELTHGVVQHTAQLMPGYQTGALNESLADMFGYLVDSANWTMGESSRAGAIRDISNPSRFGQPDRIFASNFSCTGEVHRNNGVTNKAFYLMTAGGSFNGCTINGIGKEKSGAVIYKALSTYLRSNSGFYDFHSKVNQACGDLYGATSSECSNVKAALQATELDQNRCGGGVSRKTPVCAGGSQPTVGPTSGTQPTARPQPTTTAPTSPPNKAPTPGTGGNPDGGGNTTVLRVTPRDPCPGTSTSTVKTYHYADYLCSDNRTGTIGDGTACQSETTFSQEATNLCSQVANPTTTATIAPTAGQGTTPANSPTSGPGTPTVGPTASTVVLNMKLRFQGIGGGVNRGDGGMVVRIGVTGGSLEDPSYKLVRFASSDEGIWTGSVAFDIPAGTRYCVLVKGPTHSQKKICHVSPLEQLTGNYKAGSSTIPLTLGDNTLDFTGIKMLVGDIDQNGIVNSFDLAYVRNNLGAENPGVIERCDVDWNGECNGIDYGLMVAAISIKVDDE